MKKLTLLSLLFLTLFACRNDVDETLSSEETTTPPIITISDYEPEVINVTATLFGTVLDEAGNAISGASVSLGNNAKTTDDGGRFVFNDVTMNSEGTFVEVIKNGYFEGSDRFFPQEGSVNYTTITLLARENSGNFVSSDGGVITTSDGVSLDFPANSVVSSNGTTYEGEVEVYARWIDPTAENLQEIMPGGLQGISEPLDGSSGDLEEVALASFGMVAVEIESPSGQSLNLGNDLNATITFPIPDELIGNAPAEIPLWYFSDTYGIWVREGTATLQGSNYVGEVSHFSFWNCDAPFPLVELQGMVVSEDGNPIQGGYVRITIVSSGWSACGWINSEGVFSGKVPKNEELTIEILQNYNSCSVYSANIGPFSDDVDLGTITVTDPTVVDITGTILNCNGDPLENGWVEITLGDDTYTYYVSNSNNLSVALNNCDDETEFTIVAVNIDDLEQSDAITYTIADPTDLGNVNACGNQLAEWLNLTLDGVQSTFLDVSFVIGGPDSTFLSAGLPGTDFNIYMGMEDIPGPGTYTDIVDFVSMFAEASSGAVSMQCNGPIGGSCVIDEVVITELGAVGENVIGTFSGSADFFDNMQQTVNLSFTADFQIIRD